MATKRLESKKSASALRAVSRLKSTGLNNFHQMKNQHGLAYQIMLKKFY
jgi:hypothetical protein